MKKIEDEKRKLEADLPDFEEEGLV